VRGRACTSRWYVVGAANAGADEPLVTAELLADASTIAPGATFTLGVRLKTPDGWHVYWKHPGDTGMATEVALALPKGFTAGPLQFPVPQRFTQTGEIVDFGYAGEVMLLVEVTAPKHLPPGRVELQADVTWMVCADEECIPGQAKVSLTLAAAETPVAANAELFARWRKAMPVSPAAEKLQAVTSGRPGRGGETTTVTVTLSGPSLPAGASVAYAPPGGYAVTAATVESRKGRAVVTLTVRAQKDLPPGNRMLEVLVLYKGPDGASRAVRVCLGPDKPPVNNPDSKGRTP